MNKPAIFFIPILLSLIILSCDKSGERPAIYQKVNFGVNVQGLDNGRALLSEEADRIIVEVVKALDGEVVVNNEIIELIQFGEGYISMSIELLQGASDICVIDGNVTPEGLVEKYATLYHLSREMHFSAVWNTMSMQWQSIEQVIYQSAELIYHEQYNLNN